jgi:hypothetical protein
MTPELDRRTGRTTRIVMHYVREVLDMAGQDIYVVDHEPGQHYADLVAKKVSAVLDALGVRHIRRDNMINVEPL